MSLFGSYLGDMEEDPFFGSHMRTMRQMNNMMNSLFADPFGMMAPPDYGNRAIAPDYGNRAIAHHRNSIGNIHNSLMNFGGFPAMPNYNRMLSGSLDSLGDSHCYSTSSTVVSMSSGPDGRPQVYKATASTRTAPGGIKEVQRTVSDSRSGTKKMAIGHHIGERAHIVEREQNVHSGDQEERQDYINIEEDDADDFNKEWETKTRSRSDVPRIGGVSASRPRHGHGSSSYGCLPAITAGPSRRQRDRLSTSLVSSRRGIRASHMALPPSSSPSSMASNRGPYNPPGQTHARRHKNIKTVSGSPPLPPPSQE